ncbi:nucleoside hydrolase [Algoriphagus persicinus]|uniref:nucleoside hydrolase n=1 Tax=Algoriphagus persicinus TaxID=3108754 RepID=UPI002B37835B|nr:nucleoside hydrolase [Algoriphagus sp. E1-3-M2]MEB2784296.1 nucleoside hydrolase [Algoriphagus sp. E1-3-M2]
MNIKIAFLLLVFIFLIFPSYSQNLKPIKVIFDTDMGPDYDDVGAIALLHAFADEGKVDILATIASTKYEGVGGVLDVLNTYFGRPDLPIGIPTGKAIAQKDWQHWTDTLLVKYPHSLRRNAEAPDAVALYRKILAAQPDESVTLITVGFLTNISNLLQSTADEFSPLSGIDLVRKKVVRLISMAGKFPEGSEFNVNQDPKSSQVVVSKWPKEVIYSGFEIGEKIHSGIPLIQNEQIIDSPVKDVFALSIPMAKEDENGRMSWDQTAVWVAALGHEKYFGLEEGEMKVADDGSNTWDLAGQGQFRLVVKDNLRGLEMKINDLMMHQPKNRR